MPICEKCEKFDKLKLVCSGEAKSAIRNCINTLLNIKKDLIHKGYNVLEIGPGHIGQIKNFVDQKGGTWFGIDPNQDSIANFKGSVDKIPFGKNFFDIVFASQSIEHWYEFSVTFDKGLSEIHRVLKPQGLFFLDFPIYLHGHLIFMLGENRSINRLFESKSWTIEEVEDWRKDYSPLKPYFTWDGTRKKYSNEYICEKIIRKKNKSAYIRGFLVRKNNEKYFYIHSLKTRVFEKIFFTFLRFYKYFRIRLDILFFKSNQIKKLNYF